MSWIPKKENELKIVLVGDSGVGKTQLIWKYVPHFFVSTFSLENDDYAID